jgi:hypothetical protein
MFKPNGCFNKPYHKESNRIRRKEITMTVLGHTIAWGTHIGDRHTADAKGWYASCKTWWANHKAARQAAQRAACRARWDARREVVRTPHADAAYDMVAPHTVAMTLYALGA